MEREDFPTESLRDLDALFDLTKQVPIEETLNRVVDLALEAVPGATHTSVTMGPTEPRSPAFSDGIAKELDEAQYTAGSGPCIEAFRDGEMVNVRDLCAEDRWPRFAEEARRRGVNSSLSIPLSTAAGTLGALNLYSDETGAFEEIDMRIGGMIAAKAALGLANAELFNQARLLETQLRDALASRDVIGQAKGLLMANEGCSDEEAFRMLVTASQHSNRKLREIAQAILDDHIAHISKKD